MTDIGMGIIYSITRILFIYPYNLAMSTCGDMDMERRLSGVVILFQLVSVAENKRFWS